MKTYLAMALGILLLLGPLWFLAGLVPVPAYRTGTLSDLAPAIIAGITLYTGAFAGMLIGNRLLGRDRLASFRALFISGMAGVMVAITLAVTAWAVIQWATTGRMLQPGQTLALLPILYIVGGVVSAFIVGSICLFAYAGRPTGRGRE